jgi:SAM-dependent methyltransferase
MDTGTMAHHIFSYPLFITKNLFKNLAMFVMPSLINRLRGTTGTGCTQLDSNIIELAEYARGVFTKYCLHITKDDTYKTLKDKTVLELGPGDTLATALFFIAYGAKRVVCCDRFKLVVNPAKNTAIARQVLSLLPEQQRLRLETVLTFDSFGQARLNPTHIQYLHSRNDEIALEDTSIDIIVSNAVLEHVQNPAELFAEMNRVLKPGGIMVHAADLKSHELHHKTDLDFLVIPELLWKWMTFYRGAPNRLRKSDYERQLRLYDFELVYFKITSSFAEEKIDSFKKMYPDHASQFTDDDLSCGGFLLAARKP